MDQHYYPLDIHGKVIIRPLIARKAEERVCHNLCEMAAASILQTLAVSQKEANYYSYFFNLSYSGGWATPTQSWGASNITMAYKLRCTSWWLEHSRVL